MRVDFLLNRHGQRRRSRRPPPSALACPAAYRPRNPCASSLYPLLETHFENLKRLWEARKRRFERRYGFWQAHWNSAVFSYLDCGRFESGLRSSSFGQARRSVAEAASFARVVCPECLFEFLVAFSCKGRGLCPSCGAKGARSFGWTDEAPYDAITVCALFNFYNLWINANGVHDMPAAGYEASGKRLATQGYAATKD